MQVYSDAPCRVWADVDVDGFRTYVAGVLAVLGPPAVRFGWRRPRPMS